jgi:hypothetical protein
MSSNPNSLPYFKIKPNKQELIVAKFLKRKFVPRIKEKFPQHYLIQSIPSKNLEFIKKFSKKYPYFLRLDIALYYPSINHQVLLKKIPEIYKKISGKPISKRFQKYLEKDIPEFLNKSPYKKGLSIGSFLSYVLGGIFLLDLDLKIYSVRYLSSNGVENPFLRYNDDYLIFCKNKSEIELLLKNIIIPKLKELDLEINHKKLKSGRFHQDKVDFIGFEFYAGHFRIKQEKIEEFRKKIKKITYLTKKKSKETTIKSLNNKILGFGHYYKFSSCKNDFQELDAFIRMRLRRYLLRQKELQPKEGNIILTNKYLQTIGLKSLLEIKEKFDKKFGKMKKQAKPILKKSRMSWDKLEEIGLKHKVNYLSKQIEQLTSLVKKANTRLSKIEKKLDKTKTSKKSSKKWFLFFKNLPR